MEKVNLEQFDERLNAAVDTYITTANAAVLALDSCLKEAAEALDAASPDEAYLMKCLITRAEQRLVDAMGKL